MNPAILQAVDKLNSWVRSPGARNWYSGPRYAIYDWKLETIRRAMAAKKCACRAIHLSLTCRACGGDGKYHDGYVQYDNCRKCFSKGVVTLRFLETIIDGLHWHTPQSRSYGLNLPSDFFDESTLCTEWEPNTAGRELELWQICMALNILETAMPNIPNYHHVYCHGDWIGEATHSKYKLHAGSFRDACGLCGAAYSPDLSAGHSFQIVRGHLDWSAWGCAACRTAYDANHSAAIFEKFPVPEVALTHPEIQRWLDRRTLIEREVTR